MYTYARPLRRQAHGPPRRPVVRHPIIRISPLQGFAAESAGSLTIITASHMGIPVSTSHCISSCIIGVRASNRISAVRWGVAGNIVIAWIVALPMAGGMAYVAMKVLDLIF